MSRWFGPFRKSVLLRFLLALLLLVALIWGALFATGRWLLGHRIPISPSNVFLDRNGALLYEEIAPDSQKLRPVSLDHIPKACVEATIATEDRRFYHHPGVDLGAIFRAMIQYARTGKVVSGASTITQQTVRLLYMPPSERYRRNVWRKLKEIWFALSLERVEGKDRILSDYLNHLYYGDFAIGIDAASRAYFGVPVSDLDLAECALLAGLPQNPSLYNPLTSYPNAKRRQKQVLDLMVKAGYVSEKDAELAYKEPLRFSAERFQINAPHFVMMVQQVLERELGVDRVRAGGLKIYTTLDLGLQEEAEEIVRRDLRSLRLSPQFPGRNADDAALVAMDPRTGEVLAWVGSPDYFDKEHAGAVDAALSLRQPGSSLKPITYAAAFDPNRPHPYTPATVLLDLPKVFYDSSGKPYRPVNYDRKWHGPVSLRTALACSYNLVAVKVLEHVGIGRFLELAEKMGLYHLPYTQANLSLTLGGGEETLLDVTSAYAVFATGGDFIPPVAISRVEDAQGHLLLENVPIREEDKSRRREQVLDPRVAFLITDILSDDVARSPAFGRFSPLYLPRPAAAKTGTTADWRDNWTIGYTPDLVAGVWVGNANNAPMQDVSGISGAGPIWHDFMMQALRNTPPTPFTRPPGLVRVRICSDSGLLATPLCPHQRMEWFIEGTEPKKKDDQWRMIPIDIRTGLRASPDTPPQYVEEKLFRVLPPEARLWGEKHGFPQPPPEEDTRASLVILSPDEAESYIYSHSAPASEQQIRLLASTNAAVSEMRFYVDGVLVGTAHREPWQAWWQLTEGHHVLRVEALGPDGEVLASARREFDVYGR